MQKFLREFYDDWMALMSGVIGVLSAAVLAGFSFFSVSPTAYATFIVSAFVCVFLSSYRVWKSAVDRGESAAKELRSELENLKSKTAFDVHLEAQTANELAMLTPTEIEVIKKLLVSGPVSYTILENYLETIGHKWSAANIPRIVKRECLLVHFDQYEKYSVKEHFAEILKHRLFAKGDQHGT